ncbi:MAG: 30S ribosome-binding factor RbfA [Deltaproteobacteria bacterium]|nr:30S ribosome-binding factor RbfA [Deltaproteobacteria bacterium]MBW2594427.1 30S ribosome-binding factor RbfA [Deltaproteobacteria bacterium]MBW2649727.1 30S ribosome-binding factor RbfA [Deltaproteobacteria bacterium]
MSFKRADRVADLIKAEVSDILLRDINDPQVRKVIVTGIKVTDDLRQAKVFFVQTGENSCSDETTKGLQRVTGFLRRELGKRLRLRYVPEIKFIFDESFEYGDRINRLLAGIEKDV